MKLQNLLYATMVACAFSACSNDDDPNIPDPALEMDATLTVAFNSAGNNGSSFRSVTKGADDNDNLYNAIEKIGIAVFNAGAMGDKIPDGGLISYSERVKQEVDIDTTACISAKSGKVKILVVANPGENLFDGKNNYDGFLAAISDASINSGSLLMSSAVSELNLEQGRNTIAKEPENVFAITGNVVDKKNVKVYRNVARIEVPKIKLDPKEGFGKGHTATFTLESVYVSKVRSSVKVFGDATDWCPVVNDKATLISGNDIVTDETNQYPSYIKTFTGTEVEYGNGKSGSLELNENRPILFAYDNSSTAGVINNENATRLVIRGTYEYTTDGGATSKSEHAYWTTVLNNDELRGGDDFAKHCGILRNVKYVLNVTITGPGSSEETTESNAASLTANLEVVPWGLIELDSDVN